MQPSPIERSPDTTPYGQCRWSLQDIFFSPLDEAAQVLKELDSLVQAIEGLRPTLTASIDVPAFTNALALLEKYTEKAMVLGSYGPLWFSEDTQNPDALAFMGHKEEVLAEAGNRILFFSLWWKALDEDNARRLLAHAGDLRYHLEQERLFTKHTLTEAEEKIVNIKDVNGINAVTTLYDMITSKYVFTLTVDGETKELTRDGLTAYVRHPLPEVRKSAYQELYRVYARDAAVLSQMYLYRLRDYKGENLALRGFPSPLSVRNLTNDIPDEVVDTLLQVCREKAEVFHRYFTLKARWLNSESERLSRYDLYAPLKKKSDKKIPYREAVDLVLDTFGRFAPEFRNKAERVFLDRHIDSEVRPGKRGGAFCYSVLPRLAPWVLLNYTGEPRQVATLAHELGHAIHSLMAENHSVITFHSALPLAETASVFAEVLLTDLLLKEEQDPEVRRDLLCSAIDDSYATVLRQAEFVLFEKEAHRLVGEGKTAEDLRAVYLEGLKAQFGSSVEVSGEFKDEWITIPHLYHTPFYCYAYSFGQLLSLSLYQRYREKGESFTPQLMKILSYGGAERPARILEEAGIDIRDAGFWRSGFIAIEEMVRKLDGNA